MNKAVDNTTARAVLLLYKLPIRDDLEKAMLKNSFQ